MLDFRKDPIKKTWVLIQDLKEYKPELPTVKENQEASCIFCPGNENKTPKEILSHRSEGSSVWDVRVIPHKKPKLKVETELVREGVGIYDTVSNTGAHEIIIEYPDHGVNIPDIPQKNIETILWTYKERISDLYKDKRLRYVLILKKYVVDENHRFPSHILGHSHSELLALPIIPKKIKRELKSAKEYFDQKERCIFCDVINDTQRNQERIVYQNESMIALAPFAAQYPFEVWILPKTHCSDYTKITNLEVEHLAMAMKEIFRKLRAGLNNPQYQYVLHSVPNQYLHPGYWKTLEKDYHWHIEIVPKLFKQSGFVWSSGFYLNNTPPEKYAKYLKNI